MEGLLAHSSQDGHVRLSALEQRLQYASAHKSAPLEYWQNVPKWPTGQLAATLQPIPNSTDGYPPSRGLPSLIEAITAREQRRQGFDIDGDNILVTNGALHALSLVFAQLARPNAFSLCESPVFRGVACRMADAGLTVKFFRSMPTGGVDGSGGHGPQLGADDVVLIYIAVPNNPFGTTIDVRHCPALMEWLDGFRCPLVVDMVYDDLFPATHVDGLGILLDRLSWDRVYLVNSVSKNYGAPGLRVGWVASSPRNIAALTRRLEDECVAVSAPAQLYARDLIVAGNASQRAVVGAGERFMTSWAIQRSDLPVRPCRGSVEWLLPSPTASVDDFADSLLVDHGVLVATSENYSGVRSDETFIRLPVGYPAPFLDAVLEILGRAFARACGERSPRVREPRVREGSAL